MAFLALIAGTFAAALAALGLFLYVFGRTRPERHRRCLEARLAAPPARVWGAITAYDEMPRWWEGVTSVEIETKDGRTVTWNRDRHGQRIGFVTEEERPPFRLVRRILDEGLPFGGTWTFELSPDGTGTRLLLTEDGFIRPPLFRAVAHLFMGLDATMKSFLTALSARLS